VSELIAKNIPLAAVDIGNIERQLIKEVGHDLTEAKEAFVDGLVALTVERCTGDGPDGQFIYGTKPSSRLVSGFLLPRFREGGEEDETSDIHLATMGMDLQLASDRSGQITIQPELSIYVRVLPTWEEINDPRHDMMPQVQLSQEVRRQIEDRARQIIEEAIANLPPLPDIDESEENPGDASADAARARDEADEAQQRLAERGVSDRDAQGEAEAATKAAERAEKIAALRMEATAARISARRKRNAETAAIRRQAFDHAFAELGIRVTSADEGEPHSRTMRADDLEETAKVSSEDGAETITVETEGQEPEAVAGAASILQPGAGLLDDHHAAPQPLPQKWRRFCLNLNALSFDYATETSRQEAGDSFKREVLETARRTIEDWLASVEGQNWAYRPGERILPSNFSSKQSWEKYLNDLVARRPAAVADILPNLDGLSLVVDADGDFVDPARINLRVALENGAETPGRRVFFDTEPSVFQVALEVVVPVVCHRRLKLDRVQPSYRFKDWLEYPAMGLNCGVKEITEAHGMIRLRTTWSPHYSQPRIEPRTVPGVPTGYAELARESTNIDRLLALPDAYDAWIAVQARSDAGQGLPTDVADQERRQHTIDIEAYRRESRYIREGIKLLAESRAAALSIDGAAEADRPKLRRLAAPWEAWLRTNETFNIYGKARFTDWRLFQLAFILAHIPTLASRMPEYENRFEASRDELSASLLYFATGGGKSEAFFGLLLFNLFLDRLRGKHRGVTALVRYPLRLLTLQQARRLARLLVQAELLRLRRRIPGAPFEIGFWVGSGNTPNKVAQGFGGVPSISAAGNETDEALLNPPEGSSDQAKAARRRSDHYKEALESYDKLRTCPCCGNKTGMRKYPQQSGRIGIVCFNDNCEWNVAHKHISTRTPLPFLLTDDTIYQRAPSVVLGTIDKLALIGQHDRTINAIVGMLGAARFMDPDSRHFYMPRGERGLEQAVDNGWMPVYPAFNDGAKIFVDPFPSLVIQDEGHLLEESLGTFSGLFETVFEAMLMRLGKGVLKEIVASWQPDKKSQERLPRLAKVIAATATISDPDRQLKVLYQREPLRFPCPGPNLYESFYAIPREPSLAERKAFALTLPDRDRAERASPWMRDYVSVMTNGRSHTMTTCAVVSAYHLTVTRLWKKLIEEGRPGDVIAELSRVLDPRDALTPLRRRALDEIGKRIDGPNILASLLDLQRISLTYVTNKKGGDQIIETLQTQVERDQKNDGIGDLPFETQLISGGVTISEIQDIMQTAERGVEAGKPFPDLGNSLRNIVATSAISHGVDVDKFNAMFFAGLPSDIAEYIQASSRVGRTHIGFSLLIPTPHSRRDRYVVETHDQFHRFLERMIPAPAVQRWAEKAIRRILPSILQAYLCGVVEQEAFFRAKSSEKARARFFTTPSAIKSWAERDLGGYPAAIRAATDFALEAVGLEGRGERRTGATSHTEHYEKFVENRMRSILDLFVTRTDSSRLSNFWEAKQTRELRKPMTSLRDVDASGIIKGATRDPFRGRNINLETTRQVMRIIRGQRLANRTDVDAEPLPVDVED